MSEDSNMPQEIKLDQKTIEVLVTSIIPTSKYFESRFDHFQYQIDDKLDKIIERIDRIDNGLRENRAQSMRLFTFAMTFSAISMIGLVGKMLQLF